MALLWELISVYRVWHCHGSFSLTDMLETNSLTLVYICSSSNTYDQAHIDLRFWTVLLFTSTLMFVFITAWDVLYKYSLILNELEKIPSFVML